MGSGSSEINWLTTLFGHHIRILTHGKETDNRVAIIEFIEKAHSPPSVFTRHEFVEIFYVQSGTLTIQFLHEEAIQLTAGSVFTIPSWRPHAFWNDQADSARVTLVCSPAGLDRFFEASHELLQCLPPQSTSKNKLEVEMKALRDEYGMEHVAPAPVVSESRKI